MQQPRPESRIESLEKRASTIEATIIELSHDTAEELRAVRQDIKELDSSIKASYGSIGDTFVFTWDDIKTTLASKEDLSKLEARIEHIESFMTTKDDLRKLEARMNSKLDQILQRLPKQE